MNYFRYILSALVATFLMAGAGSGPLLAEDSSGSSYASVDQIKGIGDFKFGAHLKDFPPGLLQIVDPKAKSTLLRVTPYGDNYLVRDVSGVTWGNIPVAGMVVTFHDDSLIDIQFALRTKKVDLYVASRAFRDKYGPSDVKTTTVGSWKGSKIEVTLVFIGIDVPDPSALNGEALGKVDMLDVGQWTKIEAGQKAKVRELLDQQYEASDKKVKSNL